MREFLNSVYPRLFENIMSLIRLALKIMLWPFGFLLKKLLKAVMKKDLPGRRK
jgi:hypothetical protein